MSKPKAAKLGEIDKNEDKLAVSIQEYNGIVYLEARQHYLCKETKEWKPTKKGITLTTADDANKIISFLKEGMSRLGWEK
jgi:hypothetical protein